MPDILDSLWIILVLALVFYLTWLVSRFVGLKARGRAAGRMMRVVDRLALSNDKAILLVKIGDEYCVIGVTGHEMRLLKTLSAEEAAPLDAKADAGQAWPGGSPAGSPAEGFARGLQSFSERLGFAMRRPSAGKPRETQDNPDTRMDDDSVIDMMNERIKLRKETRRR